jgi:hypothetical protein
MLNKPMNSSSQLSKTRHPAHHTRHSTFRTPHAAFRCSLGLLFLLVSPLFSANVAYSQAAKHALIVSSASGGEEFKEKFWNWSSQMYQTLNQELRFPKENIYFLAGDPGKDNSIVTAKATKGELSKVFGRLESKVKQDDLLLIVLLGHGSFDGNDYKFNLVGPDLTGSELDAFLERFSRQEVVLVCTTPCSGILTKVLSHKDRVIITATKNEFENNDTIFAQFFVEAFKNKAADSDKNQEVSMLEAYIYTAQKVDRWYKDRKRLATEHPLLEDSGDRVASPLPSPENGEGLLASKISLGGPAPVIAHLEGNSAVTPELQALYSKRQKLETALQELRYKKSSLADAEYNKGLEELLVQLAQTNQKIKNLEKK